MVPPRAEKDSDESIVTRKGTRVPPSCKHECGIENPACSSPPVPLCNWLQQNPTNVTVDRNPYDVFHLDKSEERCARHVHSGGTVLLMLQHAAAKRFLPCKYSHIYDLRLH